MFMEACLKNSTNNFVCMINNFVVWTLYVELQYSNYNLINNLSYLLLCPSIMLSFVKFMCKSSWP